LGGATPLSDDHSAMLADVSKSPQYSIVAAHHHNWLLDVARGEVVAGILCPVLAPYAQPLVIKNRALLEFKELLRNVTSRWQHLCLVDIENRCLEAFEKRIV